MLSRIPRRALLAAAPAAVLAGCSALPAEKRGIWVGSDGDDPTPSPSPSDSPFPTESPTPTVDPAGPTLASYLDKVPQFPKGPTPEPVAIPEGGSTPWWSRVPTPHKVAFITIDDGGMTRTEEAKELIRRAEIPVTLFLNSPAARSYADYFKAIQESGAHIQDHTVTHRNLKGQSYDFQRKEIMDCRNANEEIFGERPYLFRPPFGDKDSTTMKAARDCGMLVSFFWTQTVDAGIVRYQTAQKIVKPGDVLLMHFRPKLADDLIGALTAIYNSGLTPARLEDYVPRLNT